MDKIVNFVLKSVDLKNENGQRFVANALVSDFRTIFTLFVCNCEDSYRNSTHFNRNKTYILTIDIII
jgi:hypothetical protein